MAETVWERGVRWPTSGPLKWFSAYLFFVTIAGFCIWQVLGAVSPPIPDVDGGYVYRVVKTGRNAPDSYVRRFGAVTLRILAAHAGLLFLIFGGIAFFNFGAKRTISRDEASGANRQDEQ